MALIRELEHLVMERNSIHQKVDATYSTFVDDLGNKFFQIDTYGSPDRKIAGKKSQTMQFDSEGLKKLKAILDGI